MKPILLVLIGLFLLAILIYILREPILQALGDFLIIQDPLHTADVIHVISGPDNRTDYGIELYKQRYARFLFFTGGWCATIQGNHAERGRQRSLDQGIPPGPIAMDGYQVTSTYQEAERLKLWIDQSPTPIRSVILVSDPHHMRRARWAYGHVLGNGIKLIMAPDPFDQTVYQRQWWHDKVTRRMVKDEYLKMGYYIARYQFSLGPLTDWLVSLDRE